VITVLNPAGAVLTLLSKEMLKLIPAVPVIFTVLVVVAPVPVVPEEVPDVMDLARLASDRNISTSLPSSVSEIEFPDVGFVSSITL